MRSKRTCKISINENYAKLEIADELGNILAAEHAFDECWVASYRAMTVSLTQRSILTTFSDRQSVVFQISASILKLDIGLVANY